MRVSIDGTKWWENILAAFIFFTRLPFWRLHQPPKECYKRVVEYWPLAGWLTGAAMGAVIYFGSQVLPYPVAILLAMATRMLITGALHEDGLCDFFDGFGGGSDRQRILDIMKDSRIGTYGVIGLLMYAMLLFACLYSLPPFIAAITVAAGDPYAKMVASQIIMMMPYARKEEEAKAKVVYRKMNVAAGIGLAVQGLVPLAAYIYFVCLPNGSHWDILLFAPCLTMYFLYLLIWRKLRGYTGDCCGAIFLLVELTFYIAAAGIITT